MIKAGFKRIRLLSFLNVSRLRRLIALQAMRYDVLMIFGVEGWSKYGKKVNLHSIKTVNDCIR